MQRRKDTSSGKAKAVCSFCQSNPRRPGQRTCRTCHADYMRESRRRTREEMKVR